MEKIVAIIAARNEEEWLEDTIISIKSQTHQIDYIVVINDGSTDDTAKIAEKHGCLLTHRPYHKKSYIGNPWEMADLWNQGLRLARDLNPDKLLIMGADTALSPNYVKEILVRMKSDKIAVASGRLEGERFSPNAPRGTGRIIDAIFWLKINGLQYPRIPGWESWIKTIAQMNGLRVKAYHDIPMITRPVSHYLRKGYNYGRSMGANGYHWFYAYGRSATNFRHFPSHGFGMFLGYHRGLFMEKTELAPFIYEKQRNLLHSYYEAWTHRLQLIKAFHTGMTILPYPPQISSIELTNRCDLNCTFCARKEVYEHRGFGDMPYNEYKAILEKYPDNIKNLRLFLHGEPTLYPRMADAIQDARLIADARSVGFTTNGNFPTAKLYDYFESGITTICFSFEGTDRETYEEIRPGGDYDLVTQNIMTSFDLKKQHRNVGTVINIVETDQTRKGIPDFVKRWSPYVDRVKVSKLHDWGGEIHLDPELGIYDTVQPPNCFSPYNIVKILYNGQIIPCCSWLHEPMGNIFKEDLNEVWNNEKYQELRRRISKNRRFHPKCKECHIRTGWGKWNDLHERSQPYFLTKLFLKTLLIPFKHTINRMVKT